MRPTPLLPVFRYGLLLSMTLLPVLGRAEWIPTGPFGGDVRSLVSDPQNPGRMYLGTRTGQVYVSDDGGQLWSRLLSFQGPSDWVVDNLLIDPADSRVLYAGLWSLGDGGGGIFKSADSGRSWKELEEIKGQSVRALAVAFSQTQVLVAGTLQGVFRSDDGGAHWRRISPAGHAEIRNIESLAIDPANPQTLYVGTWHLPWKTTDGGAHWTSIAKGMIDDSDVFSLVVDPSQPRTLYATACTGIYRSDSAGAEWRKIQGIPYSSRRTHTLVLDLKDNSTLWVGTTEGLWQTRNGGQSWNRLTSHTWVVNAIVLDPGDPNHLFLGMDGAGVMESRDAGRTFRGSNRGFSQRQISRIVADPAETGRLYASVLHDGEFGGIFTSDDNGTSWQQVSLGPQGRDVLSLLIVTQPDWKMLAGTPDGLFEYSPEQHVWKNNSRWEMSARQKTGPPETLWVWDLYQRSADAPLYAATSAGLFESADARSWKQLSVSSGSGAANGGISAVATYGRDGGKILAATPTSLQISPDEGRSWTEHRFDGKSLGLDGNGPVKIYRIAAHPHLPEVVFVGTSVGLFRTTDGGREWQRFGHGLPFTAVRDVILSAENPQYVVVATSSGVFYSLDGGNSYGRLDATDGAEIFPMGLLAMHPLDSQQLVGASTNNGLFLHREKRSIRSSPLPKRSD